MKTNKIILIGLGFIVLVGVFWLYAVKLSRVTDIVEVSFPESLNMQYISAVEWPPQTRAALYPLRCENGVFRTIGIVLYCVTETREGAAGSEYVHYVYAVEEKDTAKEYSFTMRMVSCENYDEPQRSACEAERSAFNPDTFFSN